MAKHTKAAQRARKPKPAAGSTPNTPALKSLASIAHVVSAIQALPDEVLVTDAECEAITRLDRTSLWRIEHGLDRHGRRAFPPEELLRSYKLGPKRKVRRLGDVRKYVARRLAEATAAA